MHMDCVDVGYHFPILPPTGSFIMFLNHWIRWPKFSDVEPTRPTAKDVIVKKITSQSLNISLGNAAENINVCLFLVFSIESFSTILRICGSTPIHHTICFWLWPCYWLQCHHSISTMYFIIPKKIEIYYKISKTQLFDVKCTTVWPLQCYDFSIQVSKRFATNATPIIVASITVEDWGNQEW